MKIAIVENEARPRESFRSFVQSLGYSDVVAFESVEAAKEGLAGIDEPFVVLLDHDFGQDQPDGYELCTWLRRVHPLGLILPIVYLTGRLSPERYLANERERPFDGPTLYLAKAEADSFLRELLERFSQQIEQVEEMLDRQAAQRALAHLAKGELARPDEPDEEESEVER